MVLSPPLLLVSPLASLVSLITIFCQAADHRDLPPRPPGPGCRVGSGRAQERRQIQTVGGLPPVGVAEPPPCVTDRRKLPKTDRVKVPTPRGR